MTDDPQHGVISKLDEVVELEREALLSGDLPALADLLARKEALIDTLDKAGSGPGLEALREKAARNQVMLDGALEGIRNVAARMAAFQKIKHTLETYDENGCKRIIEGAVARQVEKRA